VKIIKRKKRKKRDKNKKRKKTFFYIYDVNHARGTENAGRQTREHDERGHWVEWTRFHCLSDGCILVT